jgi:uncharacterized protein with ParB-like and HNH nuclease domain
MKNAQKPEKVALGSLLRQLKEGRFVIPDFQREFEWKPWDIRDLLKSIFQDYYIGTLLLWKGKRENFKSLTCENIYGHDGQENPEYIVLDGQQRLTALYYSLHAPEENFPKRKSPVLYYLKIDQYIKGNTDDSVDYQFLTKKWRKLINSEAELFSRHLFPLSLLGQGTRAVIKWLDSYAEYWEHLSTLSDDDAEFKNTLLKYVGQGDDKLKSLDVSEQVKAFRTHCNEGVNFKNQFDAELAELETDYHISYIELDKDIPIEKVCDIFTQINSKGVKLDIFDLLNALLKPREIQLKSLWREARGKLDFLGTEKMNIYILQVMSILLQNYCSAKYLYFLLPGEVKKTRNLDGSFSDIVLIKDRDEFLFHWKEATEALELATNTLSNPRDYGAIKSGFVPYPSVVPIFSAIRRYTRQNGIFSRLDVNAKIRQWYWASIFSNRYSSSVESTSAKDFIEMKRWFADEEFVPQAISDYRDRYSSPDLKGELNKGTAIYTAILNMLVISGAKDFANGQYPEYEDLDDHHIVPQSWGKKNGIDEINSLCNKTLISKETNRDILGARMPSDYIKELNEKYESSEVRKILDSHFISTKAEEILLRDNFSREDFLEFLSDRERCFLQGIDDFLLNQPTVREQSLDSLNEALETIELGARQLISATLNQDLELLPQHLVLGAKERIDAELRKDITKSRSDFEGLDTVLQYFDLRDLEKVVTSKALYDRFKDVIGPKEVFQRRFGQMAELRNAIRHSRSIDEVVKKEGEAAIVWFKSLLKQVNLR